MINKMSRKVEMVGDLPVGIVDDITEWFKLFNTIDWITLASLFSRIYNFLQGYRRTDYHKFVGSCSPKELLFLMKYTEDRDTISKLRDKILKEIEDARKK